MNALDEIRGDAELRRLFGCFPTGVTALCAMDQGNPLGMTASAFVAISITPPLVSVCIRHGSATWRQLRLRPRIGISFLGSSHGAPARQLAQSTGDRFLGLDYQATPEGALFLRNATAWLKCSVEQEIAAGDHDIILFRLHRAAIADDVAPLVFHSSSFHTLAPLVSVSGG
ncbi:flavin reductase family protein [Sphingomonas sp. PL-96]|uniref:flavin reductase family protein n=1 Tax=Sphingomonas sp. PL-96 TaxID=2887201 RepID=UPI001E5374F0|nr:flavin reductase family protein [Sphingomonas sp. PL-96]MCC2978192.1 flavin reductase family protein [Sphingomonas sp. PL-96]